MLARKGDKVRVKTGLASGMRATIEQVTAEGLVLRLQASSEVVSVSSESIVNYSLAARKAWESMPQRNVGRPKGSRVSDRI
jgi:hypothetical protein